MRIIAVTGATGFIGRYVVKRLEGKYEVVKVARSLGIDIRDKKKLEKAVEDADAIVHLAAVSDHFAPLSLHIAVTVRGTENVVKIVKEYGQRLVYLSSMAVKAEGFTNYSIAKKLQDEVVRRSLEENFVGLRPSFIYDAKRLKFFDLPLILKDVWVNPIFVISVVDVIEAALKRGQGMYEIGDRKPVKLSELVKAVRGKKPIVMPKFGVKVLDTFVKALDLPLKHFGIRTAGIVRYLTSQRVCNNKRAIRDLNFRPVDTIEMVKKLKAGI